MGLAEEKGVLGFSELCLNFGFQWILMERIDC